MRAPYQILALPYKYIDGQLKFAVFHRSDLDMWQFISGGGEDGETPMEAAKREVWEEGGIRTDKLVPLKSICYIPAGFFPKRHQDCWSADTYIIPEHAFAFPCEEEITLSDEHTEYVWCTYDEARHLLKWDSNRTAMYETIRRLEKGDL